MDLKIKDVAELLNVSEATVRAWLAEGTIPAYRLNGQFRFSRAEIEDWVLSCKVEGKKNSKEELGSFHESSGTHKFSLYRAINKGRVLSNIQGNVKEELISNSMVEIAQDLHVDSDVITEMLLDRERLMPTSLNHGIAVPHTRDFLLEEPFDVVSVVYPLEPIDYGALDGEKVHTLFFLFASQDRNHLHLLAKLAHFVSDEATQKFLQTKPSKEELLPFVKNFEAGMKEPAMA